MYKYKVSHKASPRGYPGGPWIGPNPGTARKPGAATSSDSIYDMLWLAEVEEQRTMEEIDIS